MHLAVLLCAQTLLVLGAGGMVLNGALGGAYTDYVLGYLATYVVCLNALALAILLYADIGAQLLARNLRRRGLARRAALGALACLAGAALIAHGLQTTRRARRRDDAAQAEFIGGELLVAAGGFALHSLFPEPGELATPLLSKV